MDAAIDGSQVHFRSAAANRPTDLSGIQATLDRYGEIGIDDAVYGLATPARAVTETSMGSTPDRKNGACFTWKVAE